MYSFEANRNHGEERGKYIQGPKLSICTIIAIPTIIGAVHIFAAGTEPGANVECSAREVKCACLIGFAKQREFMEIYGGRFEGGDERAAFEGGRVVVEMRRG